MIPHQVFLPSNYRVRYQVPCRFPFGRHPRSSGQGSGPPSWIWIAAQQIWTKRKFRGCIQGNKGMNIRGTRVYISGVQGNEYPGYKGINIRGRRVCISGVRGWEIRGTRVGDPGYEGGRSGLWGSYDEYGDRNIQGMNYKYRNYDGMNIRGRWGWYMTSIMPLL